MVGTALGQALGDRLWGTGSGGGLDRAGWARLARDVGLGLTTIRAPSPSRGTGGVPEI